MAERSVDPRAAGKLRLFRNVAAEVRALADTELDEEGNVRMVRGYVQSDSGLSRLKELCIPVRRIYLKGDPINFEKMAALLMESTDPDVVAGTEYVMYFWNKIREELASTSILNETRVPHGEMFDAWLDAALFQDFADKSKRFDEMIAEYGKSVEGISWHLTERMAEQILQLDEVVARALGEPLVPRESAEG